MSNLNFSSVVLGGRLTADPELKTTPAGLSVTPFTIAVNNPGKDAGTSFINCVAWRKTAEFVSKYFTKGSMAVVSGRLQIRGWTDKDGNKRRTAEVVADNCYFGDSKRDGDSGSFGGNSYGGNNYAAPASAPAGACARTRRAGCPACRWGFAAYDLPCFRPPDHSII